MDAAFNTLRKDFCTPLAEEFFTDPVIFKDLGSYLKSTIHTYTLEEDGTTRACLILDRFIDYVACSTDCLSANTVYRVNLGRVSIDYLNLSIEFKHDFLEDLENLLKSVTQEIMCAIYATLEFLPSIPSKKLVVSMRWSSNFDNNPLKGAVNFIRDKYYTHLNLQLHVRYISENSKTPLLSKFGDIDFDLPGASSMQTPGLYYYEA